MTLTQTPSSAVVPLNPKITAKIRVGNESGYVAECVEIAVVTQGETLDEVVNHLQEAVLLHLEDEDPKQFGLVEKPALSIIFELEPDYA
ncbi:type II toxin-antitoxin system HicB family antitoxin [Crocosphaera sp. XPORK-15E]|uniref:type II toxin-antitoxin system HicB family antitoxin n=1 Tax=Crocosphaera sp. XPORK-15E TaxID=3110247 RepID=UPI002B1FD766|nr:type II toxin-antitoxin system HicB family antitoxin [Crocosphaera sp. XPORK-15E]MEA5534096.1 type II toxin-antitoxin system HicB family antitoxin [Crocosphaera sp. XPORK-15E]